MNRTKKGSIIVEAIVMLGLIATMTPILYKHVSERRQDIENINEANTLLLLKNATAEYVEANKETLTSGTITPSDLGLDISGYQIGIKKDSSGNIDAMITGTGGGNDLKAAKVASLLGLSAGIYSAQNTAKAWGINGVWAEDIANYGFSSLPTGIPVLTTAYDKEDAIDFKQIQDFIENTAFNKLSADEICLKENCINTWPEQTNSLPFDCINNYHCEGKEESFCNPTTYKCIKFTEECKKKVNVEVYNITVTTEAYPNQIRKLDTYKTVCPGFYLINAQGEKGGPGLGGWHGGGYAGGMAEIKLILAENEEVSIKSISGGTVMGKGGAGVAVYLNGVLAMVAGGGGGGCGIGGENKNCTSGSGGGGFIGGKAGVNGYCCRSVSGTGSDGMSLSQEEEGEKSIGTASGYAHGLEGCSGCNSWGDYGKNPGGGSGSCYNGFVCTNSKDAYNTANPGSVTIIYLGLSG